MKNSGAMKMYLVVAGLLAIAEILLLATGNGKLPISGLVLFAFFFALAFSVQKSEKFKGLSFTLQIFAFVSFTLYFPEIFTNWGFDTNKLIVPSIQVIMFGMGTKLNIRDFAKEFSKPLVVIAGTLMVFVFMPLAALLIIKVWNFPPEVAAGIISGGCLPRRSGFERDDISCQGKSGPFGNTHYLCNPAVTAGDSFPYDVICRSAY